MPPKTGIDAQLGLAKESTWGTRVAPARWLEFNTESIKRLTDRIPSGGIRAGKLNKARSAMYATHQKGAAGAIEMEIQTKGMAFWLELMLGAVATTNPVPAAVWEHTGSVATLADKSFSAQVGRPNSADGVVHPFDYEGGKVTGWTVKAAVGEIGKLTVECDFEAEDTTQVLAATGYPSGQGILSFVEGKLTVAGSEMKVKSAEITGSNGLGVDRFFTGGTKRQPLTSGHQYTGTLEVEFESLTAYNRFVNATEVALDLLFEGAVISGAHKFTFKVNVPAVRFDGETPVVEGPEELKQPLAFTALDDSLTIVAKNGDVSP